jgi:hypothetical protein
LLLKNTKLQGTKPLAAGLIQTSDKGIYRIYYVLGISNLGTITKQRYINIITALEDATEMEVRVGFRP